MNNNKQRLSLGGPGPAWPTLRSATEASFDGELVCTANRPCSHLLSFAANNSSSGVLQYEAAHVKMYVGPIQCVEVFDSSSSRVPQKIINCSECCME